MNAVEKEVCRLVENELAAANEIFPKFHSAHEGFAVIQEEIDEAKDDMQEIELHAKCMWESVKQNVSCDNTATHIKKFAIRAACEAIQVAAMAQKFLDMQEGGK